MLKLSKSPKRFTYSFTRELLSTVSNSFEFHSDKRILTKFLNRTGSFILTAYEMSCVRGFRTLRKTDPFGEQ